MSLFMVGMHKSALKKLGVTEFTDEVLRSTQKKQLTTAVTKDELIALMKQDKLFGPQKIVEVSGGVEVLTRTSLFSWGEKV